MVNNDCEATLMKITITNPSKEVIAQSVRDVRSAHENELTGVIGRALEFLNNEGKTGAKTFRSKPVVVTVEKE
jgi:hypothetical protein